MADKQHWALEGLKNVKYGPGVVGRVSVLTGVCTFAGLALSALSLQSVPELFPWLAGGTFAIMLSGVLGCLIYGIVRPDHAILEGAEAMQVLTQQMALSDDSGSLDLDGASVDRPKIQSDVE